MTSRKAQKKQPMTKQIEWHENAWVWRIYAKGAKTSAYIPYKDGIRPANISDADYLAGVAVVAEDDEKFF